LISSIYNHCEHPGARALTWTAADLLAFAPIKKLMSACKLVREQDRATEATKISPLLLAEGV